MGKRFRPVVVVWPAWLVLMAGAMLDLRFSLRGSLAAVSVALIVRALATAAAQARSVRWAREDARSRLVA
jgi:hypothetical protein